MPFKALVVEKNEEGKTSCSVQTLDEDRLPEGDVLVSVEYSTLNYKDGLCLGKGGGLVRKYPHIPGIDFAGRVLESTSEGFSPGDPVILTGWRVGEIRWGGYTQRASAKSGWLVSTPTGLSSRHAMGIGTAGLTAMLAIMELESHGLCPGQGPVLVTGATGGVGSVATALLANAGFEVVAVTGSRGSSEYLKKLGASRIVERHELSETVRRPLESETWAGCIDSVGGKMLARILGQMKYGSAVAAVGLAGGASLPATVIPFLLRGIKLLGIDSVMQPIENRDRAWNRIAREMPRNLLEEAVSTVSLAELPSLGPKILAGEVRGRVVVDVNR